MPVEVRRRPPWQALVAAALLVGCAAADAMPELAPPDGAVPYAVDDASTDRVSLAFAGLHARLRELDDNGGSGRWTPRYLRVDADADWSTIVEALGAQAEAAGLSREPRVSDAGEVRRAAWRADDGRPVAAALVRPPPGTDGATVLVLLSPAH